MNSAFYGRSSILLGVIAAMISVIIVLGGLLLAFTEGGQSSEITSFPTIESVDINTPLPQETSPPPVTPTLANTSTLLPTSSPSATSTATPTSTPSLTLGTCSPPADWVPYTIQPNDTLNYLAQSAGLSPQELADTNCLSESRLVPDTTIYLPPTTPTATAASCGPPSNWVIYTVQPGDTLFSIAQRVNRSLAQLITANCLTSDKIRTGQKLYVPFYPASIPTPTSLPPTQPPPPPPTNTSPPPPPPTNTSPPPATPTDSNVAKNTPTP